MTTKTKLLVTGSWVLSLATIIIAFLGWGERLHWRFSHLSTYSLFPLFGLLAFGIMWSHYITAALRKFTGVDKKQLHVYFESTSLVVLACLLLHPGLLIWQLWRDGFGLPPGSYKQYVAKSMVWIVILGTISLLVFLAYEFHRIFGDRKWWKYVQYGSDAAMVAILYHSLKLGSNLQSSWLTVVWYVYAVSYGVALIYLYMSKYMSTRKVTEDQSV